MNTFLLTLFFFIQYAAASDDACSNINSIVNEFTGDLYAPQDGLSYIEGSKQWAYTNYDQLSPSMIAYPKNDNDISLLLSIARLCDYKVAIRSGGHQYSALSSCNSIMHECIQIDMKYYSQMQIHTNNKTLSIGSGVKLSQMNQYLDSHNYFMPVGEHSGIGISGHLLSGGVGYLTKSHGLTLDFVSSFDIILSNGTKYANVKSPDDLYWAVLGGTPGSFGIITQFELNLSQTKNENYPKSAGFVYIFRYTKELMLRFCHLFIQINNDKMHYLNNDIIGSFKMQFFYDFDLHTYMIKIAWIETTEDESHYLSKLYLDAANELSVKAQSSKELKGPISRLLLSMSNDYGDIAPYKYEMKGYEMKKNLDEEFVDLLIDRIELIVDKYGGYDGSGMYLLLILESYGNEGAVYRNDPYMLKTSYPARDRLIRFPMWMYYDTEVYENAEIMAKKWMDDTMEVLMLTAPFNYGRDDFRHLSLTFGDVDIDNVWHYYYQNERAYQRLKVIKLKYDPVDLFHNDFTIPLPDDQTTTKQDL